MDNKLINELTDIIPNKYPTIKFSIPYVECLERYCEYHKCSIDDFVIDVIKNAPIVMNDKVVGVVVNYEIKDKIVYIEGVLKGAYTFEFQVKQNLMTMDSFHLTL